MSNGNKYYLRPTGLVTPEEGYKLSKNSNAFNIEYAYFTSVELIQRSSKSILKKNFLFNDFLKYIKKKKNLIIADLFSSLIQKRKSFLKGKKFFSNKKVFIFGILNITPDSFSDGGEFFTPKKALISAKRMILEGADFIDIGGESTRPGASKIDPSEEILRIMPVVQALNNEKINFSVDSRNSSTMEMSILSGAKMINDVSALTNDSKSLDVIKNYDVPVILMHMPGNPKNMMKKNLYNNVSLDVYDFLEERVQYCRALGIKKENLIIDPGIGFGKNCQQNSEILKNLSLFHLIGCPIMLGVSRKRFISEITNEDDPKNRLGGTMAATFSAIRQGVQIHRVHDVKELSQALKVFEKIYC